LALVVLLADAANLGSSTASFNDTVHTDPLRHPATLDVHLMRHSFQVIEPDARWVAAEMIGLETLAQWANEVLEAPPVCTN